MATEVVFFQLDISSLAFTKVTGDPGALLGVDHAEWLRPGFLEDHLVSADLPTVSDFFRGFDVGPGSRSASARYVSASGETVILRHTATRHCEREVRGVLQPVAPSGYGMTDPRHARAQVREVLVDASMDFVQSVNEISDFAALLGKHLTRQGDDLGSDYAVSIREGVERLRGLIDQISKESQEADVRR